MNQPQFQLNYAFAQTQAYIHTIDLFHKQAINTNEYEFHRKSVHISKNYYHLP